MILAVLVTSMLGGLLCAWHASNTLSLWIVSGNPPPNLVCLYICLHFNDKENEVHSNWEQILFYQVKNQSLLLLPLLQWFLKCYLLLASASLFFSSKMLNAKIPLLPCTPDRNGLNGASGLQGRF